MRTKHLQNGNESQKPKKRGEKAVPVQRHPPYITY